MKSANGANVILIVATEGVTVMRIVGLVQVTAVVIVMKGANILEFAKPTVGMASVNPMRIARPVMTVLVILTKTAGQAHQGQHVAPQVNNAFNPRRAIGYRDHVFDANHFFHLAHIGSKGLIRQCEQDKFHWPF